MEALESRAAEKAGQEIMITTEETAELAAREHRRLAISAVSAASGSSLAQTSKTRAHVEALASPRLEGRLAGSNGEKLASDYIVAELKKIGAQAAAGPDGLPAAVRVHRRHEGRRLERQPAEQREQRRRGRSRSAAPVSPARSRSPTTATSEGAVVFAGYGIVVPDSQDFGYDSYATLDVKDKIVVVLRYFPEDAEQKTKGILSRYADLRYKAMAARQHGAKAILVVTGPSSPNAGELAPMTFDTAIAGFGHRRGQHQRRGRATAVRRRRRTSRSPRRRRRSTMRIRTRRLRDSRTSRSTCTPTVEREKRTGHNVVALPAGDDAGDDRRQAVGRARRALRSSRPRRERATRSRAKRTPARSISAPTTTRRDRRPCSPSPRRSRSSRASATSCSASGRAKSSACSARARLSTTPPVPLDTIAAYLNFDMVGRMQDNKLTVQATGIEPGVGARSSSRPTSPPASTSRCRKIRISRPTSPPSTRRASRR